MTDPPEVTFIKGDIVEHRKATALSGMNCQPGSDSKGRLSLRLRCGGCAEATCHAGCTSGTPRQPLPSSRSSIEVRREADVTLYGCSGAIVQILWGSGLT